jgi:uncharacterized protein YndB with AHSA1/START domain
VGFEYRFLDRWHVPADPGLAWDVLGEALLYPRWWRSFCLEAVGDAGPPEPGARVRLLVRGFLPYRLRLEMECLEAERPRRLVTRIGGDLVGTGTWTLEPARDGGTDATLDWRPSVARPLLRGLTPVARPMLRANHTWAMRRGQREIAAFVADPAAATAELERCRSRGAVDGSFD